MLEKYKMKINYWSISSVIDEAKEAYDTKNITARAINWLVKFN